MSGRWLDITDAKGTRREVLRQGLTRVGGADAEISVPAAGADQLHVWDDPPRALFVGSGARPRLEGVTFEEKQLKPGDLIEWCDVRLSFGGEAAPSDEALVEEIPVAGDAPAASFEPPDSELRATGRIYAGLLIDTGAADRGVVRRWQKAVVENGFDADLCAQEIRASAKNVDRDRTLDRAGRLLRDFLMASMLRGVRGAGRRVRRAAKGGIAFVVAQGVALLVYTIIIVLTMLFLRVKGVAFDEYLDRILMRDR